MELRNRLLRAATVRPGVLLAVWPGATRERLFVEAELLRRGWPCVDGPATADLLVRVGEPAIDEEVAEDDWAERLWLGIPAPKALVTVTEVGQAADVLDRGQAELAGGPHQHQHQHHEGHAAHGGHDMGIVAGLPMAERADDRDGLRLDRLHVPLGPVLPDWPSGLVLRLELQGDVVHEPPSNGSPPPSPLVRPSGTNHGCVHQPARA